MIERPTARYGRQRLSPGAGKWLVIALTALVVVIGVTVAVIAYQRFGSNEVTGDLNSFEVVDDQTVEVTVSVTRDDPSRPVVCIVRARSADGSETGRREILVPPATHATVHVTATVKTSQPPTTGDVYGCGTEVPGYLVEP